MKLHLPSRLRAAVVPCLTMVTSFVPTLATGALSGGVVLYASAGSVVRAAVTTAVDHVNQTVTITGNQNTDINIGTIMSRYEGYTLVFEMSTGGNNWFNKPSDSGTQTYAGDIKISGGTDSATNKGLVINNGFSTATTVLFEGSVTGDGLLSISGNGKVNLQFAGDATQYTGAISLGCNTAYPCQLQFGNGAAAPTTTAEAGASGTGDITFTSANNTLIYNYAAGATPTYVTNKIIKGSGGTSKVTLSGSSDMYFTKNVTIDTLTVNGNAVNTAALTFTGGTITTVTGAVEGLVKEGTDTLTISGDLTAGFLTVNEGTLVLGGTTSVTQTIVNNGTLTVNGSIVMENADHLEIVPPDSSSNRGLFSDGANGIYVGGSVDVYVVKGTPDTSTSGSLGGTGTITIGSDTFNVGSVTGADVASNNFTWDHDSGVLTYHFETTDTTTHTANAYYINTGIVTYGAADNTAASDSDVQKLILNGGTLEITSGTPLNKNVEVLSDSTLYINKGVEVYRTTDTSSITENGGHVYLAGAGTYTITTASTVHVGADWSGLVKLQNVTADRLNLNNYGPRIELSGLFMNANGYLQTGTQTFTPDIQLTNGTYGAAIYLRNGGSGDTHTFSGKITGDGDIVRSSATGTNRTLKFTGDVSEWTGKFTSSYAHNTVSTTLVFSGKATTIFAGVEATANSIVNVTIDNSETVNFGGSKDAEDAEPGKIAINKKAGSTLTTLGAGAKNFLGTVEAKKLVTSGGSASFAQGATFDSATLSNNSANPGTVKNVTIDATHLTGAGTDVETLGKLVSLDVTFAAAGTGTVSVSNVVMQDVTLNATNRTVSYTNVKAVAATTGGAASPTPYAAATSSDTTQTLTAMAVQSGGNASGTLTIDVTRELLRANFGSTLNWTFLDGVTLGDDFRVELGDILAGIVSDGLPKVYLTVGDGAATLLTSENFENICVTTAAGTGGLLAGTTGPVNVTLTIENIPEPTTGTLSVLALAALAARRRRRE